MDLNTILERFTSNLDILQHLFKMLNLNDQINMTQVCKDFEYIVENFIWKFCYKDLRLQRTFNQYKLLDVTRDYQHYLTENDFKILFNLIAKHVTKLKFIFFNGFIPTDLYNFESLLYLEFYSVELSTENLELLSINCPNLQTLRLEEYMIDDERQVETLAKMKMLQNFDYTYLYKSFSLAIFNQLLNQLNLNSIQINAKIVSEDAEFKVNSRYSLTHLNIGEIYDIQTWLKFSAIFLDKFEDLIDLTLSGSSFIFDDNILQCLVTKLNKLLKLCLIYFQVRVKDFSKLNTLKMLSLEYCDSVTWLNLQQIFNDMHLEEFSTIDTIYRGINLNSILQSKSLKTLNIKGCGEKFLQYLNNKTFENLKTFNFEASRYHLCHNYIIIQIQSSNLQELSFQNVFITIKDILQLKSLKLLTFGIHPFMNSSYLKTLFKHSSITHITIDMPDTIFNNYKDFSILNPDCSGINAIANEFSTNFRSIKVYLHVFKAYQDTFLNLLNRNKKLKLSIFTSYYEEVTTTDFLQQLVNHTSFPSHIQTIKICYQHFACKDLKENFGDILENILDAISDDFQIII